MMRALFFLVVLSGCGASAPPIRPPADTSARLYFDGKLQRVPLLHARVGGRETLAILDSGAEAHLAAGWLVDQLALRTEASAATTIDPSGRTTPLRALADAAFELEGLGAWQDDELMVAELPEVFRQIGIGLILSPQRLVDAGVALVIDFPARTLWREPEARALERLGDDGRRLPEPKACVGARSCSSSTRPSRGSRSGSPSTPAPTRRCSPPHRRWRASSCAATARRPSRRGARAARWSCGARRRSTSTPASST